MTQETVTTRDGIRLAYLQRGTKGATNLLFLPGWCGTAMHFEKQLQGLSDEFRVTTFDYRGHGKSEKAEGGYRVCHLAADLNDLITKLDLQDIVVIGHSMGCTVIWAYWSIFEDSPKRISKCVFVDQPARMTVDPTWKEDEIHPGSARFKPTQSYELASVLRSPNSREVLKGILSGMVSPTISPKDFDRLLDAAGSVSPEHAGTLLIDHFSNVWTDVIPTISVPTLVIESEGTEIIPAIGPKCVAENVPNAKYVSFEQKNARSHLMFYEAPELFNEAVRFFVKEG